MVSSADAISFSGIKREKGPSCYGLAAKSPLWFSNRRDERGRKLEDFIFANGLVVLNREGQPKTFSTVNGESNIDLTLVTMNLSRVVGEWKGKDD